MLNDSSDVQSQSSDGTTLYDSVDKLVALAAKLKVQVDPKFTQHAYYA